MRLSRVVLGLTTALALRVAGTATTTLSAAASHDDDDRPYLALGDSVAFGFITQAGYEYINPDNFVGYPEYVGNMLRFDTVNAACPGEATSGFLSPAGADNGCRAF